MVLLQYRGIVRRIRLVQVLFGKDGFHVRSVPFLCKWRNTFLLHTQHAQRT